MTDNSGYLFEDLSRKTLLNSSILYVEEFENIRNEKSSILSKEKKLNSQ